MGFKVFLTIAWGKLMNTIQMAIYSRLPEIDYRVSKANCGNFRRFLFWTENCIFRHCRHGKKWPCKSWNIRLSDYFFLFFEECLYLPEIWIKVLNKPVPPSSFWFVIILRRQFTSLSNFLMHHLIHSFYCDIFVFKVKFTVVFLLKVVKI